MAPMAESDPLVFELALYLHQRQHKSTKIAMCASDLEMAREIVNLLDDKNVLIKEDA